MPNRTSPSKQSRPWPRYIVTGFFAWVIILAGVAFCYQSFSAARDRRSRALPGQLAEVSGHSMHIYCTGQGAPTVILDSGLGDSYISWRKVQPAIAQFTRVCSYDRAGLGYSDSSPHSRTSKVIAEELHSLLCSYIRDRMGPIVLVGHSMGGYDVRLYASLYREEVAGMVLVDASHPNQQNRFPAALKNLEGSWLREAEFLEFSMPFGIPRLMGFCDNDTEVLAAECNFHHAQTSVAEMRAFAQSAAQTAATGTLGDMPLAVLSHDPSKPQPDLPIDLDKPTNDAWEKMQEELAHLSTRGTQTIAKNSGHYIQLDRPDVVIDAVRRVVEQVRQAQAASKPQ